MEGLKVSDANLMVYIHPSKANKVQEAIFCQLSSFLFQYDEIFDGVLLAYEIAFQEDKAKIFPGIVPYFGVRLKAKLLVFAPKPDQCLEGKVVKIAEESIHVIVLGLASAVITSEDIRKEFKHKMRHGKDVFASEPYKKHVIKVGTMLRFSVKSFDEEVLHISGSLLPSDTGCIRWLHKNTDRSAEDSIGRNLVSDTRKWLDLNTKQSTFDPVSTLYSRSQKKQESVEINGGIVLSPNSDGLHKSKKRRTAYHS